MSLILSGTDGLSDVDGTAATPAVRGTDTNTGIFFPAADTIAFSEGGVEAMRLDSAGNVGIGTSSPGSILELNRSGSGAVGPNLYLENSASSATGNASRISFGIDAGASASSPTAYIENVKDAAGPGSSYMAFGTFGSSLAERMRIDGSGNLGLGVTPSAWASGWKAVETQGGSLVAPTSGFLDVVQNAYYDGAWKYKNTAAASIYYQNAGAHYWTTAPSGTAGNTISFTQAMTLDASGNLGIGVTSPAARLDLITSSQIISQLYSSNANGGYMTLGRSAAPAIIGSYSAASGGGSALNADALYFRNANGIGFGLSGNVGMTLDTSGNLLVGKTALGASTGFSVDANFGSGASGVRVVNSVSTGASDGFQMYSTGAGAFRFFVTFGGTINATSTTIAAISDQRLKENIQDLDVGLDKIMTLKPRKFDWKAGKGKDIKGDRGWIAQEFEQVFPDMIDEWRDPAPEGEEPYKSVRADLIPVLVKAIQEQQAIIESLTARITALEAK